MLIGNMKFEGKCREDWSMGYSGGMLRGGVYRVVGVKKVWDWRY